MATVVGEANTHDSRKKCWDSRAIEATEISCGMEGENRTTATQLWNEKYDIIEDARKAKRENAKKKKID